MYMNSFISKFLLCFVLFENEAEYILNQNERTRNAHNCNTHFECSQSSLTKIQYEKEKCSQPLPRTISEYA